MKLFLLLSLSLLGPTSQAQTVTSSKASLSISGNVLKPRIWTLSQLQNLAPVESITTTFKGKPYTARGVRLWPLIEAASPKLDPKIKHFEARFVVLARGKDGYLVSFSLPELMPDVGNEGAFLIWEAGGKLLSAKEGPLRLVVPNDKKPMRWVYNLIGIEIYDGKRWIEKTPIKTPKAG